MTSRLSRWRRWCSGLVAASMIAAPSTVLLPACGGAPPRAPTPLRPIDQAHAASIIARALRAMRFEPERGRVLHVATPAGELREVSLDVAAKGHKWGIAYVTNADGERLADLLPRTRDPERFTVLTGAGDGEDDARVVLLFAGDYMEDDMAGEAHTATSIAAEERLDVHARKIAREAKEASWP